MELDALNVYRISIGIGEKIWNIVNEWEKFEKWTIGRQLTTAADSVAANIAEGFGRYHYKDANRFHYYSRGSLFETKAWLTKSFNRKLINEKDYNELIHDLKDLSVKLNNYIKSTGSKK